MLKFEMKHPELGNIRAGTFMLDFLGHLNKIDRIQNFSATPEQENESARVDSNNYTVWCEDTKNGKKISVDSNNDQRIANMFKNVATLIYNVNIELSFFDNGPSPHC